MCNRSRGDNSDFCLHNNMEYFPQDFIELVSFQIELRNYETYT